MQLLILDAAAIQIDRPPGNWRRRWLQASSNDPRVKSSAAEYWAGQWGSDYLNIGQAGHINVDSGHGPWPAGFALFERLRAQSGQ